MNDRQTIYRLLYKSRSHFARDGADPGVEIDRIVGAAGARNAAAGVTGVLLHTNETFIQVLEGEMSAIETVFESICCDLRHSGVQLLEWSMVRERCFPEWSMNCLRQNADPVRLRINRDIEEIYLGVDVKPARAIAKIRALFDRANECETATVESPARLQAAL